jgi:hypothetical protein
MRGQADAAELAFFAFPAADLTLRGESSPKSRLELQIFGNRAGIASLANALFWLHANGFRREFLSVSELPYLRILDKSSLIIHVTTEDDTGVFGQCRVLDEKAGFEWLLPEDELLRVAVAIHRLASIEGHEYELFDTIPGSGPRWDAAIHIRILEG